LSPEISDLFARMESTKTEYIKTKRAEEKAVDVGPHQIRLPAGAVPDYIKLTKYQEFSWRILGAFVRLKRKPSPKLEQSLLEAQIKMRPEEYQAYVWMSSILVLIAMAVIAVVREASSGRSWGWTRAWF